MKKNIVLLFLLLIAFNSFSQKKESLITVEIIVSDNSGNVLKDVAIYNSDNKLIGITNQEGITWITAYLKDAIIFSHISFEQKVVKISDTDLYETEFNKFIMIMTLKEKYNLLP